jgi:hypothetical protein
MWWKKGHRFLLIGAWLLAVVLLTGCASDEDSNDPQPVVKAQLNFSLPARIAGVRPTKTTRMTSDIAQVPGSGESETDYFRGIDDVHLLCFDQYPTETSNKLGGVIEMKTSGGEVTDEVTQEDYSLCQEISIPVGTSYFGFYASAPEELTAEEIAEEKYKTRHDKLMHFGAIETVGLGQTTYQGNSGIRFRPVQICTSDALMGGSPTGQALLNLLNELMDITGPEAAPNDKWATVGNPYMNEAYQRMTQFTTLSSYNVQVMLGFILKLIHEKGADDPEDPDGDGQKLKAKITEKIISCCVEDPAPDIQHGIIVLKDAYQGFPADIHLPDGAARIRWNAETSKFEVPDKQIYSNDLEVTSVNDYAYPINLQYQVFSDILASDKQVMYGTNEQSGGMEVNQYRTWDDLLNDGYGNADRTVNGKTQSVAMVRQVNYAVGRLTIRSRIGSGTIHDAQGKSVNVSTGTFTLKGYIIGGQREVDYNFQPVTTSRTYAIYDTDMGGGRQDLKRNYWSEPDHILGLGTQADQPILVALELENNGSEFQGADGVIVNGATFYVVANLNPREAKDNSYVAGSLDKVFIKDHATQVNITINSLANATYGLPNLDIPRTTLGLSVNLSWGEGLFFDDTEL